MTQGAFWDWLYKNGRPPPPTPSWGQGAQEFYPPGRDPWPYMPQQLAGDPSGGIAWRNSLRGSPPMPWNYDRLPLEMRGDPTPWQPRPVYRNDYPPMDTTQPGGSIGGKPLYSPARQSAGPTNTPSPTPQYYPNTPTPLATPTPVQWPTPTTWNTPTPPATPTPLAPLGYYNTPTPPPPQQQFNTTFNPNYRGLAAPAVAAGGSGGSGGLSSWMLPPSPAGSSGGGFQTPYSGGSGAGSAYSTPGYSVGGPTAPAEWSLNDYVYNPNNPYAGVPWEYWGDPSLVAYINAQRSSGGGGGGGGGGGSNYAFQNQFDQAQADAKNSQWERNYQQIGQQWGQNFQQTAARDARQADQWGQEMARNKAVDQWTQAFQQAQQDWTKIDQEAKNKLTDQGQNLAAFNRRFGPNVSYM